VVGIDMTDRVLDCMYYPNVNDKKGVGVGLDPAKFTLATTITSFEECGVSNSFTSFLQTMSEAPEVCFLLQLYLRMSISRSRRSAACA
jgi:hypothetical protein